MNLKKTVCAIVLAAALTGITGCGAPAEEGPGQGSAPETSSSGMAAEPEASASETMMSEPPSASSEPMDDDGTSSTGDVVITVEDFEFDGPPSVSPGATVTIVNKDSAPHTVTSEEEGLFDIKFDGGETVTFTAPEEPGEYPYICTIHPAMMATLVVE